MSKLRLFTEGVILGACLLEANAFTRVNGMLNSSYFTDKNAIVWQAMEALHEENKPIDLITVCKEIKKLPYGNANDDMPWFIASLTNSVASTANLEYHALVLIELWLKDKLKQLAFIYKRGLLGVNTELAEAFGELFQECCNTDCDPLNTLFTTVAYLRVEYPLLSEYYSGILELDNEFNQTAYNVREVLGKPIVPKQPEAVAPTSEPITESWPSVNTKTKQRVAELEQQMHQEAITLELNF